MCCCAGAGAAGQGQQHADPCHVPPPGGEGGGGAGEEARVAAHPPAPGGRHEGLPRPGTAPPHRSPHCVYALSKHYSKPLEISVHKNKME